MGKYQSGTGGGIRIDTDDLLDLAKLMLPGAQDNAMVRAINRVGDEARKVSQDTMTKDYTFKGSDAMVYIDRARKGSLFATLRASGKRFSFMYFNAQETASGVSAQIQTGRKTSRRRAFIVQSKGKNWRRFGQSKAVSMKQPMALQRKQKEGKRYGGYPLRKLTGPAPGTILKSKKNMEKINDMIGMRGSDIFQEEIEKIFNKNWSSR
jgi:hypothetical protein